MLNQAQKAFLDTLTYNELCYLLLSIVNNGHGDKIYKRANNLELTIDHGVRVSMYLMQRLGSLI